MQIGRLRHRIEFQEAIEVRSPTGDVTPDWKTVLTRWAEILPLRGTEKFEAAQMEPRTNVKIRIRYHSGIDSTWRIKWGDKYYNIVAPINIAEKNFAIELECIEATE